MINNSSTSSLDSFSSQEFDADAADLSSNNNEASTVSTSTSSISQTSRRLVKAKRSLVWRYFKNSDDKSLNAECILCSSIISRSSTSTSNLLHHIQARHKDAFQVMNKSMKSKTTELSQRLPLSSARSSQLTQLAAELIISNLLPLSLVESPQLQRIFQEAEPTYVLPKRKYFIGNVLNQMYEEIRQKVQNELQSATGKFLVTNIRLSSSHSIF